MSQLSGQAGDLSAAWRPCPEARATWATVALRHRLRARDGPSWEACSAGETSRAVRA